MQLRDLFGHDFERIVLLRQPAIGLEAAVVIDSIRLGPAFGGIRRIAYPSMDAAIEDGLRLAASMTMKCAVSGIRGGGGKTVIIDHPGLDRSAAYRAVGRCVAELGGCYFTGPDVGTTDADLAQVAVETNRVATPEACGSLALPTARGVFAGIRAVARRLGGDDSLCGLHIAVQGLGAVGRNLTLMLAATEARLSVADLRADVVDEVARRCGATGFAGAEAEGFAMIECDILAPCALGGVVDAESLDRLRTRAIAGSANNILATPDMDTALAQRGVLYAPDFVISSGALIHGALFHLEGAAPPAQRIEEIGATLEQIFERAAADGLPTGAIAEQLARERLVG